MNALWIFIIALILSTTAGVLIHHDPGYALFAYGDWTTEMPLWLAIFLLGLIVFSFYTVFRMVHAIRASSHNMRHWYKNHQQRKARLQSSKGLLALAEGHWQQAERCLAHSATQSDHPLVNYLYAAQAAQALCAYDRRDHYLDLALELNPQTTVGVRLTHAGLQLKEGHLEASAQSLKKLYEDEPKNVEVLRLLSELYQSTQDFSSLLTLLPSLRKQAVFDKKTLDRLEQKIYAALLPLYAQKGLSALEHFWKEMPRTFQQDPQILHRYANYLIQLDAPFDAEKVLRLSLSKQWDPSLIHLYGLVKGPKLHEQLRFAESLLEEHPTDPVLLLSLGRLCMAQQAWQKAQDYCERSLRLQTSPETYAVLGQLMEESGFNNTQNDYFKKGLLLATQELRPIQTQIKAID